MPSGSPGFPGAPTEGEEPMADPQIQVSDQEIQKIIDENEAGTADLMAVYERAEASYMAALTAEPVGVVSPASTDSIPTR